MYSVFIYVVSNIYHIVFVICIVYLLKVSILLSYILALEIQEVVSVPT